MRAKSFWQGDAVQRRKPRKEKDAPRPGIGYFYTLPWQEQAALVSYTRSSVRAMRAVDREHNDEHAQYVKSRIKSSSAAELEALIIEYGYALSFFDRWEARGVRSFAELATKMREFNNSAHCLRICCHQGRINYCVVIRAYVPPYEPPRGSVCMVGLQPTSVRCLIGINTPTIIY